MRQLALTTVMLLAAQPARADNARFEASVPSENITLDQNVELTVTLDRDGQQPFEGYRAPTTPDFDVLHAGESQQVNMAFVNGRQSVRILEQHQYILKPHKKGALAIGPATVKVGGTELHTRAITIHVGAPLKNAITLPQPGAQPPAMQPAPDSMRGNEELFLDARLDKPKVYVGEQLIASWRMYTNTQLLNYRPLTEPKYEDFWSEDLLGQRRSAWDRQVVNGQEYAVMLLMKKALFPLKAGKLTITPLDVEATTMGNVFNPGASAGRRSPVLTVEVKPLPAEGRPLEFEPANVGQFEVAATVDRDKVKAGEAVTWRVILRGSGNLRNVKLPKLDHLDGFKLYDPTVKENIEPGDVVRGEKIYTYLLMPERGGPLSLPAVELAYFDPALGKYAVARSTPLAVTVEGDPSKVTAAPTTAAAENVLENQIRPPKNLSKVHSAVGERLLRGRLALVLLAGPPGAWLLVLLIDALRRRLSRETAGSKRRRARRSARRRLRVAEYHIKAQRPSAFFGECARVIYEHLEYRLGSKVEALTLSELRGHLEKHGFGKETAESVVKELENCDFARFAPSASGPGEMRAALRRVRTLLGFIEKTRPAGEKEAT
jgi:hypothetical protein